MPYWIARIILKSGELVTENELRTEHPMDQTLPIVVGDINDVVCRERIFPARVVWGDWPGRHQERDPCAMVPLRVEEL